MLFIAAMARKKEEFGEEPEPDFVGGDSIERKELWEVTEQCSWLSGHMGGGSLLGRGCSSGLVVLQTPANIYESSGEWVFFADI